MAELMPVELGPEFLEFVRGRTAGWTGYPLREALASQRPNEGRLWTWGHSPLAITPSDLEGRLPQGMTQEEARDQAIKFMSGYVAPGNRRAILEDYESSPGDPWLTRQDPPYNAIPDERLNLGNRHYWYATDPAMVDLMLS